MYGSLYTHCKVTCHPFSSQKILGLWNHSVVICCDSYCALIALKTLNPLHPLVREVQDRPVLMSAGKKITLSWVPTHVASNGNEQVGCKGKAVAAQPCDAHFPLQHDLKPNIRNCLHDEWLFCFGVCTTVTI